MFCIINNTYFIIDAESSTTFDGEEYTIHGQLRTSNQPNDWSKHMARAR